MDITSVLWIAGIFCIILVVSEIVTDILYKVCPPFRRWIGNEMEEGENCEHKMDSRSDY